MRLADSILLLVGVKFLVEPEVRALFIDLVADRARICEAESLWIRARTAVDVVARRMDQHCWHLRGVLETKDVGVVWVKVTAFVRLQTHVAVVVLACQCTCQSLLEGKLGVMLLPHENLVQVVLRLLAISMADLNSHVAVDVAFILNLEATCTL